MVTRMGFLSSSSCFPCLPPRLFCSKRRPFPMAAWSDDPIREWILYEGKATQITRISPVGGGCINLACRYDTDAISVKTNKSMGPSMFEGEAVGLGAMYETGTIRVPRPYRVGALPAGGSYIIMEFVEFGFSRGDQSVLGRKLAEMHNAGKSRKFFFLMLIIPLGGYFSEDFIEMTLICKTATLSAGQRLVKNLAPLFEGVTVEPCLLHGDLWSGNISSDKNGDPVILDPACYYGYNEAEFGMSWCAGFGGSFYNSFFEDLRKGEIFTFCTIT